jgi:putative transposase
MICSHYGNTTEQTWGISSRVSHRLDSQVSKKIPKRELKSFIEKHLFDVQEYDADVKIEKYSIQIDHLHLLIIIPPRYSVSGIIGKIRATMSREIRKNFEWVKKIYWRNEFWSPGFFFSTVRIDEEVIKRYIESQEKIDKGEFQLSFEFKFQVPRA